MLRVLLVLEDYGELMFLQTILKKIGFDVDSIQNPRVFHDGVLRMNPDLIVMTATGKRVRGLDLSRSLKRVRGLPRVILLRTNGQVYDDDPTIEAWLDSPVAALDLLNCIGDVCGLNKQMLQDKFHKLQTQENESEPTRVLKASGTDESTLERGADAPRGEDERSPSDSVVLAPTTMTSEERSHRYKKFLAEPRPAKHGYALKQVQDNVKALRKQEESDSNLEDLERERKAFVEHLFRKKPSTG